MKKRWTVVNTDLSQLFWDMSMPSKSKQSKQSSLVIPGILLCFRSLSKCKIIKWKASFIHYIDSEVALFIYEFIFSIHPHHPPTIDHHHPNTSSCFYPLSVLSLCPWLSFLRGIDGCCDGMMIDRSSWFPHTNHDITAQSIWFHFTSHHIISEQSD